MNPVLLSVLVAALNWNAGAAAAWGFASREQIEAALG